MSSLSSQLQMAEFNVWLTVVKIAAGQDTIPAIQELYSECLQHNFWQEPRPKDRKCFIPLVQSSQNQLVDLDPLQQQSAVLGNYTFPSASLQSSIHHSGALSSLPSVLDSTSGPSQWAATINQSIDHNIAYSHINSILEPESQQQSVENPHSSSLTEDPIQTSNSAIKTPTPSSTPEPVDVEDYLPQPDPDLNSNHSTPETKRTKKKRITTKSIGIKRKRATRKKKKSSSDVESEDSVISSDHQSVVKKPKLVSSSPSSSDYEPTEREKDEKFVETFGVSSFLSLVYIWLNIF
jgi:hypothetical protein